jgi:hypothetical protein
MRDLRRHHLERTFAHQFRKAATRQRCHQVKAHRVRRWGRGGHLPFRSYLRLPSKKIGLAAAKQARRHRQREEIAYAKQLRRLAKARARQAHHPDENMMPQGFRQESRPMTRWELYYWFRQQGRLELFYTLYPK